MVYCYFIANARTSNVTIADMIMLLMPFTLHAPLMTGSFPMQNVFAMSVQLGETGMPLQLIPGKYDLKDSVLHVESKYDNITTPEPGVNVGSVQVATFLFVQVPSFSIDDETHDAHLSVDVHCVIILF